MSEVEYFSLRNHDSCLKHVVPGCKLSKQISNNSLKIQMMFPNKILIVDDEEFNIRSLKAILKSMKMDINLHVEHAMSGEEALQRII